MSSLAEFPSDSLYDQDVSYPVSEPCIHLLMGTVIPIQLGSCNILYLQRTCKC